MRKKVYGVALSRNTNSRRALFRSLVFSLVENGKIETTKVKAKAIQADVDKLMTLVSKNTLSSKRLVLSKLANNSKVTEKLFSELSAFTKKRKSGFTRIISLPRRKGDNAEVVRLEFVDTLSVKEEK